MASGNGQKSKDEITGWERVETAPVADCRVFRVRRDISLDPRKGTTHDFFVIDAPDWINVIPVTTDGRVILIEQYRHGTAEITLEIPGGMVDEGESPSTAAARELLEETGYEAERLELLGRTRPNPAIQNNSLHIYLARNCRLIETPRFDGVEHIGIRFVSFAEVPELIASGAIDHALVVAAFYYLFASQGEFRQQLDSQSQKLRSESQSV
jgi:ADP-ribose pyrophosphatase